MEFALMQQPSHIWRYSKILLLLCLIIVGAASKISLMETQKRRYFRDNPSPFHHGKLDNQAQAAAGLLIVACGAQGAMVARVVRVRSWVTDN